MKRKTYLHCDICHCHVNIIICMTKLKLDEMQSSKMDYFEM